MKRIILLLLILIGISIIPFQGPSKYKTFRSLHFKYNLSDEILKNPEIQKWEYIKTRLFEEGKSTVAKFNGPILINLEDASPQHKNIVDEILKEIKELIPNKTIAYFKDYTGFEYKDVIKNAETLSPENNALFLLYTKSIKLCFKNEPDISNEYIPIPSVNSFITSTLKNGSIIKRSKKTTRLINDIEGSIMYFNFSESTTYQNQKKYIKYEILKSLSSFIVVNDYRLNFLVPPNNLKYFNRPYNKKYYSSITGDKGVYSSERYFPGNYNITQLDTFLIQKLYADDFLTQFSNYLVKHYSWRYQFNFLHKEKVKLITIPVITLLGVIILILSFQILHKKRFRFSYLNYFLPIFIIYLSFLQLNQLKSYMLMDFNVVGYLSSLKLILAVLTLSCAQSFILWSLEKLLIRKAATFIFQLFLKIIFTYIVFIIPYFILKIFQNSFHEEFFNIGVIIAIIRGFYIYINHYSESLIKQKDVELSQLKELQAATELHSLHAQVNPHFLYNALNSIASLAHINADKTERMALSLSDLFRYSINRKGEKMSTIKEEVEMVENYLEIEKIRFEDRLEFTVDVEPTLLKINIPRFLLQPLIENAVKHGISNIEGKGNIHLMITKNNNNLLISVSDNGPHFPDGLVSGHGLQSVYDLLRLSYGEQANMNWENSPKKKITITISSNS